MSQPFLYLFHRHAVCKKKRRTAVPKIMESYMGKIVLIKQLTELIRYIVEMNTVKELFAHPQTKAAKRLLLIQDEDEEEAVS